MMDVVNHPPHYRAANGVEVIDVVEGFDLNHRLSNVVEYVLRADRKGAPLQDLRKAKFYLDREIGKRDPTVTATSAAPPPMPLHYLATPYTKFPLGIHQAYVQAAMLAARLMTKGHVVYSPIVHCHPLSEHGGIDPLDHSIWLPFNEAMLARADILLVAHMDGWQASYGVSEEIKFFEAAGKPILDLYPDSLSMRSRSSPEQGAVLV